MDTVDLFSVSERRLSCGRSLPQLQVATTVLSATTPQSPTRENQGTAKAHEAAAAKTAVAKEMATAAAQAAGQGLHEGLVAAKEAASVKAATVTKETAAVKAASFQRASADLGNSGRSQLPQVQVAATVLPAPTPQGQPRENQGVTVRKTASQSGSVAVLVSKPSTSNQPSVVGKNAHAQGALLEA
mmetsp:Transcript_18992/g.47252  ORF Transcript_18992/g.47252 Transcript_18992/m.47252 type:complete len:186 (-) Transcript_18992:113-670(-)